MNVSSVKNLNGETFSAVQDAALTDVVQTNSGNWQDITAYQNASANYLTAVNLPESADWNDTTNVVQSNSSTWGQGGGSVDTIPFVVNSPLVTGFTGTSAYIGLDSTAIDMSPYVPYSALGDDWDGKVHTINGSAIYAEHANESQRAQDDSNGDWIVDTYQKVSAMSDYQTSLTFGGSDNTLTAINGSAIGGSMESFELSAGNNISIIDDIATSSTIISVSGISASEWNGTTDVVQANSSTWNDITAYQTTSSTYLTALPNTASINVLSANDRVRVGNDSSYKSYAHIDRNGLYFKDGNTRPYNIGIDSTGSNFYIATAQNGYARIYASSISGWNDAMSSYQNASGTYLTAVDLTPYQTIEDMTAYQPVGDYYSASNPSGFISEIPESVTAVTDYVTATSGNINDTINNVTTNSGAWGGSALPISAGAGISIQIVNNVLVISTAANV